MLSDAASACPRCGAGLPARALGGLCPECLIRVSLRPLTHPAATRELTTDFPPPPRLGDFELIDEIGHGGMGVVWRARQSSLNRLVALKMVRSEVLGSTDARQRCHAEAEAAATLSHPHIVPVFDVGEVEGRSYFAMQLVEGGTLADHLADGLWSARHCPAHKRARLPWPCRPRCCPRGAALVAKLARAVHHAHQHGVLHRDLKPGNILLDEAGEPHITDFGLARWLDLTATAGSSREVVGTPSYMAPEQAGGDGPVTTAADIYSLGAILYHILTGRPPFLAETAEATLRQAREQLPPSAGALNPDVDRDLEAIALKCLEKNPAQRYASAASLADDLDRWQRGENIRARTSSRWEQLCRWTRRRPSSAALVAALNLVALAGFLGVLTEWFRAERHAGAARTAALNAGQTLIRMHVANGVRAVETGDLLGALPWFAEASRLEPANERHRLCLVNTLRSAPMLVQASFLGAPVTDAAWAPDGSRILACAENGRVLVASVSRANPAEAPRQLPASALRLAVAPSAACAAVGCSDGRVFLLGLDGSGVQGLPGPHTARVRSLAFDPTSRHLAAASDDQTVHLWNLTAPGANPRVLPHENRVFVVAFSPDGALLVTATHDGVATLWRVADGTRVGTPIRSSESLFVAGFSPDGTHLLTAGAEGGARLWSAADQRPVGSRMSHATWVTWAGFSPNGRFIATGSDDTSARLWSAQDGRPLTPPLRQEGPVGHASFDYRSQRLATAGGDQTVRLWSVPEGSPIRAPLRHGGEVTQVAWQPGGNLLLTACGDGLFRIWEPEPPPPSRRLTEGFTSWNVWFEGSGDRFIASGPGGRVRMWDVTNARPASPLLLHPALVDHVALRPDGTRLLTACRDSRTRVWDLTTGRETATVSLKNAVSGVAWRADGTGCAAFTDEPVIHLFEPANGQSLGQLAAGATGVCRVAFAPQGPLLAAAYRDGTLRGWHTITRQEVFSLRAHSGVVESLRFSPDGERVLSAGQDGTARLTAVQTGVPMGAPMLHADTVRDARFDAAGKQIVTASADGTARVWDAATGTPSGSPMRPQGGVSEARFSQDSRFVLTRNADAAQVWDAASGTLVLPRFAPEKPVAGAAFSADNHQLWVVSEQLRLYPVELTSGGWSDADWQFAARFLSCREVDATGGLVAWSPRLADSDNHTDKEPASRWDRLRRTLEVIPVEGVE